MAMIDHPDCAAEQAHLRATLDLVGRERQYAREEQAMAQAALERARSEDPDAVPVRELLCSASGQTLANLALSARSPYFTRLDFVEKGKDGVQTVYIGRTGVLNTRTLESAVVDWRAPVANLYYSGQLGQVSYQSPDGLVEGELRLKRQLTVREGKLESIFDTDLASRDQYLQSVLGQATGERLREIVTTIQAEQNYVIRYPLGTSLIVQGVAGSGKTSIALHRIAYLLYVYQRQLRPQQMLILAPNPLFLGFIAGVLPDLGVEEAGQTTFMRLMQGWLGSKLKGLRSGWGPWAGFKGSIALKERLDNWLDEYEKSFARPIRLGRWIVFDRSEMEKFLLEDEKPFPMERRLQELKKPLGARARSLAARMEKQLIDDYDKKLAALISEGGPGLPARRAALVAEREQKALKARDFAKTFSAKVLAAMPTLDVQACYRAFWQALLDEADPRAREAARWTLDQRGIGAEDIAALALIAARLRVMERPGVRHIVVDEAQDFRPLDFCALRAYAPQATMTVVGDLMQGIYPQRGLGDWSDLKKVLGEDTAVHHLLTSYRCTVEIMFFALRVARKRPVPGQREPRPVLRHGEPVNLRPLSGPVEQAAWVAERVARRTQEGYASIAVIARDRAALKRLSKALPQARMLDLQSDTYPAGTLICPAEAVKGFEFDAVILADAGAAAFPDEEASARILYVTLTRALHRLDVGWLGERSPLLDE